MTKKKVRRTTKKKSSSARATARASAKATSKSSRDGKVIVVQGSSSSGGGGSAGGGSASGGGGGHYPPPSYYQTPGVQQVAVPQVVAQQTTPNDFAAVHQAYTDAFEARLLNRLNEDRAAIERLGAHVQHMNEFHLHNNNRDDMTVSDLSTLGTIYSDPHVPTPPVQPPVNNYYTTHHNYYDGRAVNNDQRQVHLHGGVSTTTPPPAANPGTRAADNTPAVGDADPMLLETQHTWLTNGTTEHEVAQQTSTRAETQIAPSVDPSVPAVQPLDDGSEKDKHNGAPREPLKMRRGTPSRIP